MTWNAARRRLVDELRQQGIHDHRTLEAIERTPRHLFVPEAIRNASYENRALPIDCEQTISQPYIVALMTQALELTGAESVLEIGTGSGYQTAILAGLSRNVVTIERHAALSQRAQSLVESLGIENVAFHVGDGTSGIPGDAFDRILVTAGAPSVPEPLVQQLAPGGRLVIPVGSTTEQALQAVHRTQRGVVVSEICRCRFVKLVGRHGWRSEEDAK